jgi:hypothetical protein
MYGKTILDLTKKKTILDQNENPDILVENTTWAMAVPHASNERSRWA